MAISGPNTSTTVTEDTSFGSLPWTDMGNAAGAQDGLQATISGTSPSYYMKAVGFSHAVPTGATIDGIGNGWYKGADGISTPTDNRIRALQDGLDVGTDVDLGIGDPWPGTDAWVDHGGATELWGTTWTAAQVNHATEYGNLLSVNPGGGKGAATVDAVRNEVHYTAAGAEAEMDWHPHYPVEVPRDHAFISPARMQ